MSTFQKYNEFINEAYSSVVRVIQKGEEGRLSGYDTDILWAGNFEHSDVRATYSLFDLDVHDESFIKSKNLKMKLGEKVYRIETEKSKKFGIKPFVKINLDKGLVYFNAADKFTDDIEFETKGSKIKFLNLVQK